jgi:hypothetical protein
LQQRSQNENKNPVLLNFDHNWNDVSHRINIVAWSPTGESGYKRDATEPGSIHALRDDKGERWWRHQFLSHQQFPLPHSASGSGRL